MLNFIRRKTNYIPVKREILPRASFLVYCSEFNKSGYTGFVLKNPEGSNKELIMCPVCNRPYSVRVKCNEELNVQRKAGTRHVITLINLTKSKTYRDF